MNIVLGSAFFAADRDILYSGFWRERKPEAKKVSGGFNGGEENMAGSFRNG